MSFWLPFFYGLHRRPCGGKTFASRMKYNPCQFLFDVINGPARCEQQRRKKLRGLNRRWCDRVLTCACYAHVDRLVDENIINARWVSLLCLVRLHLACKVSSNRVTRQCEERILQKKKMVDETRRDDCTVLHILSDSHCPMIHGFCVPLKKYLPDSNASERRTQDQRNFFKIFFKR